MPRKLAKPEDQMKRQLIANIQYEAEIRSIDREGQALVAHCSEGTYRKRIKDPGTFTVEELSRLAKKFGVPIQNLFKARVVADE